MGTHSSILARKILWREERGGFQSTGSQRVAHDGVCVHANTHTHTQTHTHKGNKSYNKRNTCPFWWAIPICILGYSDTPSPQSHCAIISEKCITVSLFICLITSKVIPDAFVQIAGIFLNWTSILIPEVCANWGCHVDGRNEAKYTSNDKCCSKTVIHSGIQTALFRSWKRRKVRLQGQILILKGIMSKSPFTLFPIPWLFKVMYNH